MKNLKKTFLMLGLLLGLFACSTLPTEEDSASNVKSSVKFTMENIVNSANSNILFSSTDEQTPSKVALTYKKSGENEEETSTIIKLTAFGDSYITDDVLSLYEGTYVLTKFDVLNDTGETIYSTPVSGSDIATSLDITTPLAHNFDVNEGEISMVKMQVVEVSDTTDPADFGHAAFTFDKVDFSKFYIDVLVLDETEGWVYTTAQVEVKNAEGTSIKTASLENKMNKVIVANSEYYTITISKDGYASQELSFSEDDLAKYEKEAMVVKLKKAENTHRYEFIDSAMTWTEAKAYCESLGGHLVTITSQEEQNYIYNSMIAPNGSPWCWAGASDAETEGIWKWVTGEKWEYTNWTYDNPNNAYNGTEDYMHLCYRADKWNDVYNDWSLYFICEWE